MSVKVVQREDSGLDKDDSSDHEQWSDSGCYVECQAKRTC